MSNKRSILAPTPSEWEYFKVLEFDLTMFNKLSMALPFWDGWPSMVRLQLKFDVNRLLIVHDLIFGNQKLPRLY